MSTTPGLELGPSRALLEWLTRQGIEHEIHEHPLAFTARETARADGVPVATFAKVVGAETSDGRTVLFVLDANDRLSLTKAAGALSTRHVRLLSETQLQTLAPGTEAGALPAVGALYDVHMYVDHAVRDNDEISFNAGSHRFSVRVDREDWERAARPTYADLADHDAEPAWAR
jgi:Ala-tRNA(Pro) deacylase